MKTLRCLTACTLHVFYAPHLHDPTIQSRSRFHTHPQEIRLDVGRGMTVLDALIRIKQECDGSLALRYSCRSAICGSCAMTINGSEKLACRTSLRKELERHGHITVAPLRNLPVIKDLVVDMASFWEKIRDVHPWLYRQLAPSHAGTLWRRQRRLRSYRR